MFRKTQIKENKMENVASGGSINQAKLATHGVFK